MKSRYRLYLTTGITMSSLLLFYSNCSSSGAQLGSSSSSANSVTSVTPNPQSSSAPTPAAQAGYNLNTFHTGPFTSANVDITDTAGTVVNGVEGPIPTGMQWFFKQPFWEYDSCHTSSCVSLNADGSITLTDTQLNAFYDQPNVPWHGVGFGGGAYFEATLSFNPQTVNTSKGWPSWWAMALEQLANNSSTVPGKGEQWPGMPNGYTHFIETDFFEADACWNTSYSNCSSPLSYGGATHDWGGTYGTWTAVNSGVASTSSSAYTGWEYNYSNDYNSLGIPNNYFITTPTGTNFTQPHRYGYLWVPATSTTLGYAQYYFDGVATGDKITWSQYDCANPPSGPATTATAAKPWIFGILDCQHPSLILATGTGEPLTVYSVDVWQASAKNNLSQ
jgi:hypothetical protein